MRALALLTVLTVTVASAATAAAEEPVDKAVMRDRIAAALYDRGLKLYDAEMWSDAKALFEESLARSPRGPRAADAKAMIAKCEAALNAPPPAEEPADDPADKPAGDDPAMDEPVPEAEQPPAADDMPLDPYSEPIRRQRVYRRYRPEWLPPTAVPRKISRPPKDRLVRNLVVVFGGGTGAALGYMGFSAFTDSDNAGVLPVVLGSAAVGLGTSWLMVSGRKIAEGDASVMMSATTWAGLLAGAVANMVDDPTQCSECLSGQEDVGRASYYGAVTVGASAGLVGGIFFARRYHPSAGDVGLTNSFIVYGAGVGLFAGVIMHPSQGRAYTFNSTLGAAIGLGVGIYMARRIDVSRNRALLMDLAALAGALAGYYVIGGLIDQDDGSHTDEQIRGTVGAIGMGAGAFLAWFYTRGKTGKAIDKLVEQDPAPPALVTRASDGEWRWGALAPSAYGTVDGRSALGVSIVSGRF